MQLWVGTIGGPQATHRNKAGMPTIPLPFPGSNDSHLQRHRRDIHEIQDHACDLCNKDFSTKANLKRHKHINHELLDNLS